MAQVKGHFVPEGVPDLFTSLPRLSCGSFGRVGPGQEVRFIQRVSVMDDSELDLSTL